MAPKAAMLHLVLVAPLLALLPFSSLALTQDFCVADLALPDTPAGYPCKSKLAVTSADFHSAALAQPGLEVPPFKTALASATVKQFPGLNGLGLAATRVDIQPGGVVPLHTHPEASELLFVAEGTLSAGFISADTNVPYVKTVSKGELFLFPQGLLHYQYNIGNTTAVAFAAYSNPNPGLQLTNYALFANTQPTTVVEKVTSIDHQSTGDRQAEAGLRPAGSTVMNKTTFIGFAEILKPKVFFSLRVQYRTPVRIHMFISTRCCGV